MVPTEAAGRYGDAPQWQFAFMDDRIRTFEGRPQRYGTQLRFGSDGLEPCPIENEMQVDILRKELGLPNLSDVLEQVRANPPSNPTDQSAKEEAEMKWRREVGWLENVVR